MKLAIFSLFLAVSTAAATAFNETTTAMICGTVITDEEVAAAEAHFKEHLVPPSDKAGPVTIPVVFHVISADNTAQGGNILDSQIFSQIQVLNRTYAPAGLSFNLKQTTRTTNARWFNNVYHGTPEEAEMRNSLRVGNEGTLNVYTVGFVNSPIPGLIGYATFPLNYTHLPQDDGTIIRFNTVPGGSFLGYNSGKNLVHEVGHWVGLYHTFQGGCSGNGDEVDDTPPQRNATLGDCPFHHESCFRGVFDPVDNYMDYSSEACKTQFTPGQFLRMKGMLRTYRHLQI